MENTEAIWQQRLAKRREGMPWKAIIEAEGEKYGGTFTGQLKSARARGWIPPEATLPPAMRGDGRRVGLTHQRPATPMAHPGTPEHADTLPDEQYTQEHHDTPEDSDPTEVHHGTLEGHQEVMEEVHQSVPDVPHIATEEPYQSTPEHHSTPVVHPELSVDDSSMEHPGVPARQDHLISTPMVHPGTPSEEDWELWTTIKAMWPRVEKMLSDQQVLLSTLSGTSRQTQKKTYVFDVEHIALINEYARVYRLELKDVIYTMCQEFFERRATS